MAVMIMYISFEYLFIVNYLSYFGCQDFNHFCTSLFNERFAEIEVLIYMSKIHVSCYLLIPMVNNVKKLFGLSLLVNTIIQQ